MLGVSPEEDERDEQKESDGDEASEDAEDADEDGADSLVSSFLTVASPGNTCVVNGFTGLPGDHEWAPAHVVVGDDDLHEG